MLPRSSRLADRLAGFADAARALADRSAVPIAGLSSRGCFYLFADSAPAALAFAGVSTALS